MSHIILDGKAVSQAVKDEIKLEIQNLSPVSPILAVVLIGDDKGSKVYLQSLQKPCEYVGIKLLTYQLPEETSEKELLELLNTLSISSEINGILLYLPLPAHIDKNKIMPAIDKNKDIDCFNPYNMGLLSIKDNSGFKPCTPLGILYLLKHFNVELEGKDCVIIGRNNTVGKPLATILLAENSTVTICHSYTKNLENITKRADILIVTIGKSKFVTADMVKENAVVVDVGINVDENGKLCGDVDYDLVKGKASYITPVPGGIGPMTTTMLLKNCLYAYKMQNTLITP